MNLKRDLETQCELRGQRVVVNARARCFPLKAVLQLDLGARGKTICSGHIDPPKVLTPANVAPGAIVDLVEELLVPAERGEKLRREFVFTFEIVSKGVGIAHARYLKTRFVKFRPALQMMPREAHILSEDKLAIIVEIAATR